MSQESVASSAASSSACDGAWVEGCVTGPSSAPITILAAGGGPAGFPPLAGGKSSTASHSALVSGFVPVGKPFCDRMKATMSAYSAGASAAASPSGMF
jgi:hypothetical protein